MKECLLVGFIIIAWLSQVGAGQKRYGESPATTEKYTFTTFWEGKTFYTEFSEKDVSGTPSWNPENGNPPISVSKALTESRAFLRKYFPDPVASEIESITYGRVGKDKWVYVIAFDLDRESARFGHSIASFKVILKMDGTFFEPKVTTSDK